MAKQVTGNEAQFNEKVTFLKNIDVNQNVVVGSAVTINASTGEISANEISANSFVGSGVTINSSGINVSGAVTATSFSGDGSLLTGVAAANNGVFVTKNNVLVGTPGIGVTIGLGTGLNGEQPTAGIVTIFLDAAINDLTNVNASPNTSDVLQWDGTSWIAANPTSVGSTIWKTLPGDSATTLAYYEDGAVAIGTASNTAVSASDGLVMFKPIYMRNIGASIEFDTVGCINMPTATNNFRVSTKASFSSTGIHNFMYGFRSGLNNSTGSCNIFMGYITAFNNTTGSNNIVLGTISNLGANASNNNVIGCAAQAGIGTANNVIGENAGGFLTSGNCNNYIGWSAGKGKFGDNTGSRNTAIGCNAAAFMRDGNDNVVLGTLAGLGDATNGFRGCSNVILGAFAGYEIIAACCNVFIGQCAAYNIESGGNNIAIGSLSSCCLTNGTQNTTIGFLAGRCLTTGSYNILIGSCAGEGDTSGYTGSGNVFLGQYAGQSVLNGGSNVAIGQYAARSLYSGSANVAVGLCAAYSITSGDCNVAIGCDSGKCLTIGARNVFIGQCAGHCTLSGFCNVMIGPVTGSLTSGNFVNNNIAIGWYAGGDGSFGLHCLTSQSNKIVIGNSDITNFYTHMAAKSFPATTVKWCSVTNELAADTSSCRFKTNINPFLSGVAEILKLNSVQYNSIEDPDGPKEIGLIAEEVAETGLNQLVSYDNENQPISVSYDRMAALFINAIKELHQENQELKNEISLIKNHLDL